MKDQRTILTAPSLLAADFCHLADSVRSIEVAGGDWLHLDIMDNVFVPALSFGPVVISPLRHVTKLLFDVHLMVENPDSLIADCLSAGADSVTFHWESAVHHHRIVQKIQSAGKLAGIALVPSTPVDALSAILPYVDQVLVLSVNPGQGGQTYLPATGARIKQLASFREAHGLNYKISVDGGINLKTKDAVIGAGADVLVTGSAFFQADDRAEFLRNLKLAPHGS